MKALAFHKGSTSTEIVEIPQPTPTPNKILVKVQFSAIDTSLDQIVNTPSVGAYLHDLKDEPLVVGYHYSGKVVGVGEDVNSFEIGDQVFGNLQYEPKQKQGAFSEFLTIVSTDAAVIPSGVLPQIAAASTTECQTALQAMRDLGGLHEKGGQSVLINGAGGGVGSVAVGIAKALRAKVTAICSTKDVARMEQYGADVVIDRTKQELNATIPPNEFDVVFDIPSKFSFWQAKKWLKTGGTFVNTLPSMDSLLLGWFWPIITKKHIKTVLVQSKKDDLNLIGGWIAANKVTIDVDSIHKIGDFGKAWNRQNETKNGHVVIQVEDSWWDYTTTLILHTMHMHI